jgi:hypothetical protein
MGNQLWLGEGEWQRWLRERRDGCGQKWRKWRWEWRFVEVGSLGGWLEGGVAKGKRPGGGRLFGEGESVFLFMWVAGVLFRSAAGEMDQGETTKK